MRVLSKVLKNQWSEPPFWAQPDPPMYLSSWAADRERIETDFFGLVEGAYKANGVVFACVLARLLVFSEARFQWRRFEQGRPTQLFGDPSLAILEKPWPNGTTGELLARMEQDSSFTGNFYATVVGEGADRRVRRMNPEHVTVITGSPSDDTEPFHLDARPVGYLYSPPKSKPRILMPDKVVHYSPIPDPVAQ